MLTRQLFLGKSFNSFDNCPKIYGFVNLIFFLQVYLLYTIKVHGRVCETYIKFVLIMSRAFNYALRINPSEN